METLTGTSVNVALWDLTAALGGEVLALGGLAADAQDGVGRIEQALESGSAAEWFGRMVAAQGGPADSTRTVVYYVYDLAFQELDISYACAAGLALFLVVLLLSLLQQGLKGSGLPKLQD